MDHGRAPVIGRQWNGRAFCTHRENDASFFLKLSKRLPEECCKGRFIGMEKDDESALNLLKKLLRSHYGYPIERGGY